MTTARRSTSAIRASPLSVASSTGSSARGSRADQLGDRRLRDAALAERRQHLRDVVQEGRVRARPPARRSAAAARDRCRAGRRRGAARPRSCRCPARPGCTARCRGRRGPGRPGRAGWWRRCRASARRGAVRSPRAADPTPGRAARRGRGARPRTRSARRRGSRTGGAAATPMPVGRGGAVEGAGDRRAPVDDDRVAGVVAHVPAADVEAPRCRRRASWSRSVRPKNGGASGRRPSAASRSARMPAQAWLASSSTP